MIVSDDPASFTPHILDGTVYSIVQVGDMVVVGGQFSQVRSATSQTILTRRNLVAFNATTGIISNSFVPNPNSTVYKVQAATDGASVYVGGRFTSAYGVSMPSRLFKANVEDGTRDPVFRPGTFSGDLRDLEVMGNRLWVAGKFTHVGGVAQKALGTINATTGARDPYFTGTLAGTHRDITTYTGDRTNVLQISSNPQNTELVAVGNFTSVNGATRHQIVKINTSSPTSATLSPWSTNLFTQACSAKFETYMSDVEYSPKGQFFVVSTSGAYGGTTNSNAGTSGCDVVARWEANTSTSPTPATWTAYTGGDSTWTVEVTDDVVYAGGHQRWQNNPGAGDSIGAGAVERTGIAALNTLNGMPYSWNPTRTRGVGIQDMLATSQGLWVGSDTERIGRNYEYHSNIALMPLAGGKALKPMVNATLPVSLHTVASGASQLRRRTFDGIAAGANSDAPNGSVAWGSTTGAFMANGVLYTGSTNGTFTKRTFNGTSYGPATTVSTSDALARQATWHDQDVPEMSSLFYLNGLMYFTRTGVNTLYRRGFEPESDVVGQQRFSSGAVTGIPFASIRGAFVANNFFYYATSAGLFRANWNGNAPAAGAPTLLSATSYASRVMFPYQGDDVVPPVNQPPVADADITCIALTCTFDASDSDDPDGQIETWAWNFGDPNQTGSGETTMHTYPSAGPRTVTLTVTDDDGASHTVQRQINPTIPVDQPPTADAAVTCVGLTCTFDGSDSDDPDGEIEAWAWDFGDLNETGTGETTTHTYPNAGPRTVTLAVTDDDGLTDIDIVLINPTVPVDQPPTAAMSIQCDLLECSFDGTDSEDAEGPIASYVWDFGDGDTDSVSGANATHTYLTPGERTVTLTVTDSAGQPDEVEQVISPTDVANPIAFVGAASTVGNREQHIVPIPGPVEAGDALVLFFAANTTNPTYTGPAGWTQIGSTSGGGTAGRAYSKVASATDALAGATVRVVSSGYAKSQISIAAYRGTDATTPVAASASGQDGATASHTSPTVVAPAGNNWLVTYFADESSGTSGWTPPASQTLRNTLSHSGSGHMSGLVVDSNSNVSGSTGGLTAVANSTSSRGVSFSVVLH